MAQKNRWRLAQEYELQWWGSYKQNIEWYRNFSRTVEAATAPYLFLGSGTSILEIGSGAAGALTFLDSGNKYAVDPLEDYFAGQKRFAEFRDPRVRYLKARGEELPFRGEYFDLVIIDNVLDHCEFPGKVLDEVGRMLKPGGVIFFRQNVYLAWGRLVRRVMELFAVDRGHPFTFSRTELEKFFRRRRWAVKDIRKQSFRSSWLGDLKEGTLKGYLKAVLVVTRLRTIYVLARERESG